MTELRRLAAAALAGGASGCRSFTGIGVLALTAPADSPLQPDRSLATVPAQGVVAALAAAELVADKLPNTPARSAFGGLAGRGLGAASSGVVVARRETQRQAPPDGIGGEAEQAVPPTAASAPWAAEAVDIAGIASAVVVSVAAALGAGWLGLRWRGWAARAFGADWIGAALEDLVALGLAGTASALVNPDAGQHARRRSAD